MNVRKGARVLKENKIGMGLLIAIISMLLTAFGTFTGILINAKDAQIADLQIFKSTNIIDIFETQKKLYTEQIKDLEKKINELKVAGDRNSQQVIDYENQVIVLQSKINIIKEISADVVKQADIKLSKILQVKTVIPFCIYKIPDGKDPVLDSIFRATFLYYLLKSSPETYKQWIKTYDSLGHFVFHVLQGKHTPLYYSFDSTDLRTSSFINADLSGVDLSKAIVDKKTKFPQVKK